MKSKLNLVHGGVSNKEQELYEREMMIVKLETDIQDLNRQLESIRKAANNSQNKLVSDHQKRIFNISCKLEEIMGVSIVYLTLI